MSIYLIRHGQTNWNLEGRWQGREDIPLNDTGLEQARRCGEAFRGKEIKAIYTSPLIRAYKTGLIITDIIGLDQDKVITEEGLMERDFGTLSGMFYDTTKNFDSFSPEDEVEPFDDLCKRMMDYVTMIAKVHQKNDVIMVSHGGSINAVIHAITNGEQGSGKTRLKNTCINVLKYEGGNLVLKHCNLSAEEFETKRR